LILSLFSSPSEIFSKIQNQFTLEEIQYIMNDEDSRMTWETKYGPIQIVITEYTKNQIGINPIPGKTTKGWENLIPLIYNEDRKMMTEIIERLESFGSISAREIMMMDEDEF
jgi:hypothetical protein